jgi:hypothetical protein
MILNLSKFRSVFYNYGILALNIAIPLFILLYVVSKFGLNVYGEIVAYQIVAVFSALFVDFGISFSLLKRLKGKRAAVQSRVSRIWGEARLAIVILVGVMAYFLTYNLSSEYNNFNLSLIVMGYSFSSAVSIELYWLQDKISRYFLILFIGKFFAILIMLTMSADNYLFVYSIAVFFSGLFVWIVQYIDLFFGKVKRLKLTFLPKYFAYIFSFTILKISSAIYSNIPRTLNLSFLSKSELGSYMIWDQIYQLFNLIFIPINLKIITMKNISNDRNYFLTISVFGAALLYSSFLVFESIIYEILEYLLNLSQSSVSFYANYFFIIISLGFANSILGMPACSHLFKKPVSNFDYVFGVLIFLFFLILSFWKGLDGPNLVISIFLFAELAIFLIRFTRIAREKNR